MDEEKLKNVLKEKNSKNCEIKDEGNKNKCICFDLSNEDTKFIGSIEDEFKEIKEKGDLEIKKIEGEQIISVKIEEKQIEIIEKDEEEQEEKLGLFEKYMIVWVAICMGVGIGLSQLFKSGSKEINSWVVGNISIPIGVCLFFMMYPSLIDLQPRRALEVLKNPKPIFTAMIGNWIFAPFVAWAFAKAILGDDKELILAAILLGSSPCTAMVIVWGKLAGANQEQNFINTTLNTVLMIFLFAPLTQLYSGVSNFSLDWEELFISVAIFIGTPIVLGLLSR